MSIFFGTALLGCGDTPSDPTVLAARTLDWNPTEADLGLVSALAEFDHGVVVFGEGGASVVIGGAVVARSTAALAWRAAAQIPAGDGTSGRWVVGVSAAGRLLRLSAQGASDDITDRYRLGDTRVRSVVALGPTAAAFTFDGGFAVADGATVTRYDGDFPDPVGGRRLASVAARDTVRVFDPVAGRTVEYAVPGVVSAALDDRGRLAALTASTVYAEDDGGRLQAVFTTREPLHGLAASGRRVWFGVGTELGLYDGLVRLTRGADLPPDARLVGSPGGTVWALSRGRLTQYATSEGVTDDQIEWERTVRPVFARRCAACHLPGGSANLDLTAYAAWSTRRPSVRQRAVIERTMPPDMSTPLTRDELDAVSAWTLSGAP